MKLNLTFLVSPKKSLSSVRKIVFISSWKLKPSHLWHLLQLFVSIMVIESNIHNAHIGEIGNVTNKVDETTSRLCVYWLETWGVLWFDEWMGTHHSIGSMSIQISFGARLYNANFNSHIHFSSYPSKKSDGISGFLLFHSTPHFISFVLSDVSLFVWWWWTTNRAANRKRSLWKWNLHSAHFKTFTQA